MEFITIRVVLAGLLCSAALGVEKWSWKRDSRLETLSKVKDEGKLYDNNRLSLCFCLITMAV